MTTKYVFVTGGIVSGIGKGITTASIGALLKSRGFKVGLLKIDPYINSDAGTMNPFQHGEVFVTDDGAETDLDLGHYERFTDQSLTKLSNFTTGSVYGAVLEEERKGDFLGKTIQIIPHITDEIKQRIRNLASTEKPDVEVVEIGGTVGDIEALPFIEAARQFGQEFEPSDVCYVHVVKMDYIYPSDEAKTKPIQQSVVRLREHGINPDLLVVRCKRAIEKDLIEKIALFTGVKSDRIIEAINAKSLYDIPVCLESAGLGKAVSAALSLPRKKPNLSAWVKVGAANRKCNKTVRVGLIGKYLDHPDAYLSVVEALKHGGLAACAKIEIIPIDSEAIKPERDLKAIDVICVPGGFGIRGIEGKIAAIEYAINNKIPFLGLCLGLQCAVIAIARYQANLTGANSTEFDRKTKYPVIDKMVEQKKIQKMGGTMRLGCFEAKLKTGSLAEKLYRRYRADISRNNMISERHRHRFEVNSIYIPDLAKAGLIFSGINPQTGLVEFIELSQKDHPYFIATQAHPEFKSRPTRPHPLFAGLITAAIKPI